MSEATGSLIVDAKSPCKASNKAMNGHYGKEYPAITLLIKASKKNKEVIAGAAPG